MPCTQRWQTEEDAGTAPVLPTLDADAPEEEQLALVRLNGLFCSLERNCRSWADASCCPQGGRGPLTTSCGLPPQPSKAGAKWSAQMPSVETA